MQASIKLEIDGVSYEEIRGRNLRGSSRLGRSWLRRQR